jgi:hypothetical protein
MRSAMTALACAVLGTLGLLASPASSVSAASVAGPASLAQLTSFHQMVVDTAAGHVFLSDGVESDWLYRNPDSPGAIIVTSLTGGYVTTLDAGKGVEGLALSADGSVLYAALANDQAVDVIDTATLTSATQYSLGTTHDTPYGLAIQDSKLWVSYNITNASGIPVAGFATVGDFDLTVSSPAFETQAAMGHWYSAPDIAADPNGSGVLAAVVPDIEPAEGATYSTTADPVTALAAMAFLGGGGSGTYCGFEDQFAVFPGGSRFVAACGGAAAEAYSSTDIATPVTSYTSAGLIGTNAVAVSANGTVATGAESITAQSFIDVYQPDGTLLNVFSLGSTQTTAAAGLAWSADGSQLFAVLQHGTDFSLAIYSDPAITRSALTLSGPAGAVLGGGIAVHGSLTLVTGAALPADTSVTVTTTAPDNTKSTQSVQPASDGSFTLSDNRTQLGTYTYDASYAGATGIASATATIKVTATRTTSTLTLNGPSHAVIHNDFQLNGALTLGNGTAPPANAEVTITRTAPDKTRTTQSIQPAPDGTFRVPDNPAELGTYRYAASYPGSAGIGPASATFTVTATRNPARFVLSGPPVVTFGDNVLVRGTLAFEVGGPAAGTPVTVVRTVLGSTATKKFPLKVDAHGRFALTDPAPAKGRYAYTATYGGNPTTAPAKGAFAVTVTRTPPVLQVVTSAPDYVYGTRITVTAVLGATFADRTVSIYAKPVGEPAKLLKTGKVNAHGNLSASYVLPRSTVFSAVFAGDVHNAPKTASHGVGAWAKVFMSNSGYFKTVTSRGIKFRVYHHTGHLNTSVTVTPNKHGQCVSLEVQQWDGLLGWMPNETFACLPLSGSSQISTYLTLLKAAGAQYRMRADYVRGDGDTTNLSTDGAWFYFEVVT